MVSLTTTAIVQIVAILTIPLIVGAIAATQINTKAKFQWKQGRIAMVLSLLPTLIIFALQDIMGPWVALVSLGGVAVLAVILNPD